MIFVEIIRDCGKSRRFAEVAYKADRLYADLILTGDKHVILKHNGCAGFHYGRSAEIFGHEIAEALARINDVAILVKEFDIYEFFNRNRNFAAGEQCLGLQIGGSSVEREVFCGHDLSFKPEHCADSVEITEYESQRLFYFQHSLIGRGVDLLSSESFGLLFDLCFGFGLETVDFLLNFRIVALSHFRRHLLRFLFIFGHGFRDVAETACR